MDKNIKNEKIIKCPICKRVIGRGKLKIAVVCMYCYKSKGGRLSGAKLLELKEQTKELPRQEEFSNFLEL